MEDVQNLLTAWDISPCAMSLWRAKRRQTVNRRFRERADETLLAINTLHAESEGLTLQARSEETRKRLLDGAELLNELSAAVESPANADDYHFALAQAVMRREEILEDKAITRFRDDAFALEQAADELTYSEALERAKQTLDAVKSISSQASEQEEAQLRRHFAN